ASAAAAVVRQADFAVEQLDQTTLGHARQQTCRGLLWQQRQMAVGNVLRIEVLRFRWLALFAADPDLLQQMIEANFVFRGGIAAVGRISQGTRERMAGAVLRAVEMKMAVSKLNAAIGVASD